MGKIKRTSCVVGCRVFAVIYGLYLAPLLLAGLPGFAHAGDVQAVPTEKVVLIGLRANRGAKKALKRWQPTADYLTDNIHGYRFKLVPHEINATLNQAVSREEFDFLLTNPASYVELNIRYNTQKLVTLSNKRNGKGYVKFGSVIFTRSDNDKINTLQDLKGKSFMGADELGFGGWRVAWRELLINKVNPHKDFSSLSFAGGIQQRVVRAVLNGDVDAGSVRTDMLERMAQAGELNLDLVKVLGQKQTENFPFYHSTELYPEWPFAKLAKTDDKFAQKVASVLLSIDESHNAAIRGKYTGWRTDISYKAVEDLLKELKIGPYAIHKRSILIAFLETYWHWIVISTLAIALFISMYIKISMINVRLRDTELQLLESNVKLKDMTLIDGLTGLGNRRKLNEYLEQVWGQVCRDNIPVCILLLDIDYFKDYNDTYGHLAGDDCLKKFANLMTDFFRRSGEIVIRYGGEEFLIFKIHCNTKDIYSHAEEFRNMVERMGIEHKTSKVKDVVTTSIGIATISPDKNADPLDLIKKADMALYEAKKSGRNQTKMCE